MNAMKLYADAPARRATQVLVDLLFLLWLVLWIWIGHNVHDATLALRAPGEQTESAASALADNLRDGSSRLGDIPLVGDEAAAPLDGAAGSADDLAQAGRDSIEAVESLAWRLGLAVAVIPILIVGAAYLPPRLRFIRDATSGQRFMDSTHDLDLFALRALANQPLHELARISPDPAGAWRAGDPAVVRQLAVLELRDVGLRPPELSAR
jgi:hypothetical protein